MVEEPPKEEEEEEEEEEVPVNFSVKKRKVGDK